MRYHVPFAHRNQPVRQKGPVFIGFDEPVSIQKRKQPFNWCGFMGMMMALISPFTLFLLAPVALFFSVLGLRRAPRGMAKWGVVLSLMATTALSLGIFHITERQRSEQQRYQARVVMIQNQEEIQQTNATLEEALTELREFRSEHDHQLPNLEDGMMLTVRFDDAWDEPLRYGTTPDGCIVRSMGPDKEFDTQDDLIARLDGTPMVYSVGTDVIDD